MGMIPLGAVQVGTVFNLRANDGNLPLDLSNINIHTQLPNMFVFAHFLPWFQVGAASSTYPRVNANGDYISVGGHVETGYNSDNVNIIATQMGDIYQRGFDGVTVDWHGPNAGLTSTTTQRIRDHLNANYCSKGACSLKFGVMEDHQSWQHAYSDYRACQAQTGLDETACITAHLQRDFLHLNDNFFPASSYLRATVNSIDQSNGRPVTHFFVPDDASDTFWVANWQTVYNDLRSTTSAFINSNPHFIFRNPGGFSHVQSDGAYAWFDWPSNNVDSEGSHNAANDAYLANFYSVASSNTGKQAWGATYKGFDERRSGFSGGSTTRFIRQRCGRVWLDSLARARNDYSGLSFVQIPTWNDYDEGTEIESGIDNCVNESSYSASVDGSQNMSWSFAFNSAEGTPDTVNHYELYKEDSGNLIPVDTAIPTSRCSFNGSTMTISCSTPLSGYGWASNTNYSLRVKQVSKSCLTNHLFGAISWTAPGTQCLQCDIECDPLQYFNPICGYQSCSPSQQQLDECLLQGGEWNYDTCRCEGAWSPIIIDVGGNGMRLTAASEGIFLAPSPGRPPRKLAWTEAGSDDAFLALDRNGNGTIDDLTELFGNFTEQPAETGRNGYLALAVFDSYPNGGNQDGIIDNQDSIFDQLRLWRDANHNGISEPEELTTLAANGIASFNLDYKEDRRRDRYGNVFRYRGKVNATSNAPVATGRWSYDVFLQTMK